MKHSELEAHPCVCVGVLEALGQHPCERGGVPFAFGSTPYAFRAMPDLFEGMPDENGAAPSVVRIAP